MASSQGFWTSVANASDPKRKFRFLVTIGSMPDGATWYSKSINKPTVTIAEATHKFLNHTFHYPGSVTWNEITATLVDPVSPDAAVNLSRIIKESGYHPPVDVNDTTTISKSTAVAALQSVVISQINSGGAPMETWTLVNAFITEVDYGGELSYDGDDLAEISVKFRYDWASIETFHKADSGPSGAPGKNRYWMPGQSG